jgi:hypothetical protein
MRKENNEFGKYPKGDALPCLAALALFEALECQY